MGWSNADNGPLIKDINRGSVLGEAGTATHECWRCGVVFDPTEFIPGAPCADCQLDDPMYEWVRFEDVVASEAARRDRHVERLWKRRYSDREIAESLGMNRNTVRSTRARLGLAAHTFTGDEKWRDHDGVRAQIGERNRERWK